MPDSVSIHVQCSFRAWNCCSFRVVHSVNIVHSVTQQALPIQKSLTRTNRASISKPLDTSIYVPVDVPKVLCRSSHVVLTSVFS